MSNLDDLKKYRDDMEAMRKQLIQIYAHSPLPSQDMDYVRIAGNYLGAAISAFELEIGLLENSKAVNLA